mmetsp:Transcript_123160/g.217087  ORF Transcript_123160/g.217087 Transcript_123160/m.217087 type:complete len:84 (-) Transcript_123160:3-254(-)
MHLSLPRFLHRGHVAPLLVHSAWHLARSRQVAAVFEQVAEHILTSQLKLAYAESKATCETYAHVQARGMSACVSVCLSQDVAT